MTVPNLCSYMYHTSTCKWLIDWCFTPLSTVFQSYQRDSSYYSCLSWVSPVLGWALKCLAQGHSHEKTKRIQCSSNPGPLDYESNTLPLSHVRPAHANGDKTQALLTLYHTISPFNDPKEEGNQHFLLFP